VCSCRKLISLRSSLTKSDGLATDGGEARLGSSGIVPGLIVAADGDGIALNALGEDVANIVAICVLSVTAERCTAASTIDCLALVVRGGLLGRRWGRRAVVSWSGYNDSDAKSKEGGNDLHFERWMKSLLVIKLV